MKSLKSLLFSNKTAIKFDALFVANNRHSYQMFHLLQIRNTVTR